VTDLTVEALRDTLTRLGQSVAEVADALLARGITGKPYSPTECPIARYLEEVFDVGFEVSGEWVWAYTQDTLCHVVQMTTPVPIERFIDAFDRHDIPELIAPGLT
jgi:hypothetical protein